MDNSFKDYMKAQVHEIEIFKWIESEKVGRDLGVESINTWIKTYAKSFRESWNSFNRQ
jgi:hypothetical protein